MLNASICLKFCGFLEVANSLSKDGANEITGKPLAPKTIRHNLSLISDIFGYAIKMGVVSDNPCSKVTAPKCSSVEKKIYTVEEITKLLQELRGEPLKYQAFFNLAAFSGFRRGELLGLEWKDIDFESCVISIRRTSCYTAQDGTYTDTTKTHKSQRSMKFPRQIMDILRLYKDNRTIWRTNSGVNGLIQTGCLLSGTANLCRITHHMSG